MARNGLFEAIRSEPAGFYHLIIYNIEPGSELTFHSSESDKTQRLPDNSHGLQPRAWACGLCVAGRDGQECGAHAGADNAALAGGMCE